MVCGWPVHGHAVISAFPFLLGLADDDTPDIPDCRMTWAQVSNAHACRPAHRLERDGSRKVTWSALALSLQSAAQVLVEMRQCLEKKNFTQVPQLSSSYKMPLGTPFAVKPPGARRTKALLIGINYVGHEVGELRFVCGSAIRIPSLLLQALSSLPSSPSHPYFRFFSESNTGGGPGSSVMMCDSAYFF